MDPAAPATPLSIISNGLDIWPQHVSPSLAVAALDAVFIQQVDALDRQDTLAFQSRQLSAVVQHASAGSQAWAARLERARASGQWNDVPVLGREDYRALAAAGPLPNLPDNIPAREKTTSGSSGIPVKFYVCDRSVRIIRSLYLLEDVRQGVNDGRRRATITMTAPRQDGECVVYAANAATGAGLNFARYARQFSIEAHARWLPQTEAPLLWTAPAILDGMMDVYEAGDAPSPKLDAIFTYAETVTSALRRRAWKILGARIIDRYSCEELGPIAFQCPQGHEHYHVNKAHVLVEVIRDDGSPCALGETGRLIVSGLNNYASPVLRYEIGDIGALESLCPCGHVGPVLSSLLGRKRFLIRLPSGERRYVGMPSLFWRDVVPVRERRIAQYAPDTITVEIVRDHPLTAEERDAVVGLMHREVSPEIHYEIAELTRIDWGPSYKRQDVVSFI